MTSSVVSAHIRPLFVGLRSLFRTIVILIWSSGMFFDWQRQDQTDKAVVDSRLRPIGIGLITRTEMSICGRQPVVGL